MTTMKNMTRGEAETILGMKGAYVYKDVNKAYRAKVKTCHPDAGGSAEDMIKVNAAKSYMDDLFSTDKNAVYSCVGKTETSSKATAATAEKADEKTTVADDYAKATAAAADPEFWETMNAADNYTHRAERGERVRAAYRAKHGTGVAKNAENKAPENKAGENTAWWATAYGTDEKLDTDNAPAWFKVGEWLVNHFPWRLALFLVSFGWFFVYAYAGSMPMTSGATIATLLFAAAGLLNLVTGCFTTPLRKAIRNALDAVTRASG